LHFFVGYRITNGLRGGGKKIRDVDPASALRHIPFEFNGKELRCVNSFYDSGKYLEHGADWLTFAGHNSKHGFTLGFCRLRPKDWLHMPAAMVYGAGEIKRYRYYYAV